MRHLESWAAKPRTKPSDSVAGMARAILSLSTQRRRKGRAARVGGQPLPHLYPTRGTELFAMNCTQIPAPSLLETGGREEYAGTCTATRQLSEFLSHHTDRQGHTPKVGTCLPKRKAGDREGKERGLGKAMEAFSGRKCALGGGTGLEISITETCSGTGF